MDSILSEMLFIVLLAGLILFKVTLPGGRVNTNRPLGLIQR